MKRNHTMMQFFEWHVAADGEHWKRLAQMAPELKAAGIDSVWVPPLPRPSRPKIPVMESTICMTSVNSIKG